MRGRTVWFAAGTAAGVYASVKARRAVYRLSMPGLIDQAAALGLGARAFASELRDGMTQHEHRLATRLDPESPTGPGFRTPTQTQRDHP